VLPAEAFSAPPEESPEIEGADTEYGEESEKLGNDAGKIHGTPLCKRTRSRPLNLEGAQKYLCASWQGDSGDCGRRGTLEARKKAGGSGKKLVL